MVDIFNGEYLLEIDEEKTIETKEMVEDKPDDNEFSEEIQKIKSKGKRFK